MRETRHSDYGESSQAARTGRHAEGQESRALASRVLGRTGVHVASLGLGLGPLGLAGYSAEEMREVVAAALREFGGTVLVDVSPGYGDAERRLAPALREWRDRLFLTTKVGDGTATDVVSAVRTSRRRLGVDRIDAVLLNHVGTFDLERLFSQSGPLAGLQEAQEAGLLRYVGLTGHSAPEAVASTLESGAFDLAIVLLNFVDRHVYDFEGIVLPVARQHEVGVAAMKALGGAVGLDYSQRTQEAMLLGRDHELAIRYVLDLPDVATAVIGCKTVGEVEAAALAARRAPTPGEEEETVSRGRELAARWGRRFDPPLPSASSGAG